MTTPHPDRKRRDAAFRRVVRMSRLVHSLPHRPWRLVWRDWDNFGFIVITDADGFDIASRECARHRWRYSPQARQLQAVCDVVNMLPQARAEKKGRAR
jgi:hypothetical protein